MHEKAGQSNKNFQQKSNFNIQKPEILNAFTELNLFHNMIK